MSLRAIKKREQFNATGAASTVRPTLFKKSQATVTTSPRKFATTASNNLTATTTITKYSTRKIEHLKQQSKLLGRITRSSPELRQSSYSEFQTAIDANKLLRSKSDSDLGTVKSLDSKRTTRSLLMNAKSEVCLQSISAHNYEQPTTTATATTSESASASSTKQNNKQIPSHSNMLTGARSHRDLTQSAYVDSRNDRNAYARRMSECSLSYSQTSGVGGGGGGGGYTTHSQRSGGSMFASQLTLASNATGSIDDPNAVLRVPIIGYEVMEERARFTVYKLRVENPVSNDCWLVLRRYTDFVRLNSKLKQAFPSITLLLPRKKLFGDNFNSVFLDNRVQGLQMFVNSIMANEELRKCKLVREFFCLDEPPSYSESMEECRAIFEAQEETITHLKLQIQHKNDLILSLQQKLHDEIAEKEQIMVMLKTNSCDCSSTKSSATPH